MHFLPYADIMLQLNRLWIDAHYINRPPAGGGHAPGPPLDLPLLGSMCLGLVRWVQQSISTHFSRSVSEICDDTPSVATLLTLN